MKNTKHSNEDNVEANKIVQSAKCKGQTSSKMEKGVVIDDIKDIPWRLAVLELRNERTISATFMNWSRYRSTITSSNNSTWATQIELMMMKRKKTWDWPS